MFVLNNRVLSPDVAFEHEGVQYPANWLRLASAEDKAAIGITEWPDPEPYDDRFFWGPKNPKNVEDVRTMLVSQIKQTAYSMLAPTDYKVIRSVELGEAVDAETAAHRAAVRAAYQANKDAIMAASTTEQLAALQLAWPVQTP